MNLRRWRWVTRRQKRTGRGENILKLNTLSLFTIKIARFQQNQYFMVIVEDKGWQTLFQNWIKWFSVQPLISVWAERKTGSGAKPT